MSDEAVAFKVGDRVVLTWLGPDQPEGVVTRINVLRTYPSLYTVSLAFASGKDLTVGPSCLRPASDKGSLPAASGRLPEPTPPFPVRDSASPPLLAPDWEEEDLSESALAQAVADWERSVGFVEAGYDYRNDFDEYAADMFNRESIHAFLHGLARANLPVPLPLANRIASADQRFRDLTVGCTWTKSANEYDPTAFWYYFRWPRTFR